MRRERDRRGNGEREEGRRKEKEKELYRKEGTRRAEILIPDSIV